MSYYIVTASPNDLGAYLDDFLTAHPQAKIIAMAQSFAGVNSNNSTMITLTILYSEA